MQPVASFRRILMAGLILRPLPKVGKGEETIAPRLRRSRPLVTRRAIRWTPARDALHSLLLMGVRSVQLGWSSGMQRALGVDAAWTRHAPLWPRGPLTMTDREWLIQNGQTGDRESCS